MKKLTSLSLLSCVLFSCPSFAEVIYGNDHRIEVSEAEAFQRKSSESAVSILHRNEISIDYSTPGLLNLSQRSLKDWLESQNGNKLRRKFLFSDKVIEAAQNGISFCPSERFIDQPNPSMCSGFLIAPDLVATAGHCAELPDFCADFHYVFDFTVDPFTGRAGLGVKEENVYSCKRVVSHVLSEELLLDYAVVQLDRRVKDRMPLDFRNHSKIEDNTPLFVIGSPSGLPLKVATGANVRGNENNLFFSANLDTFQGNSGSAVFNQKTGVVEGILVRGENDFVLNYSKMCIESNQCTDSDCRGEDVTRMTSIPEVAIQVPLNEAASRGDIKALLKLLYLNTWVDFNTKDGVTAFINAIKNEKFYAAEALLGKSADPNHQDALGNTGLHYLVSTLTKKKWHLFNLLLSHKANLDLKNDSGDAAIHIAAKKMNLYALRLLLKNGAYKNSVDADGESVLFPFAKKGMTKVVKELISLGVDPSIKNNKGLDIFSFIDLKSFK